MVTNCRDLRGCPASLYLSNDCPFKWNKSCWEVETGCPSNNQCQGDCNNCCYFPPELKEKLT